MEVKPKRCCETFFEAGRYRPTQCSRDAKIERDGKPYCGQHDPVNVEKRRAARIAKWDREYAAKAAESKRQAERQELERLSGFRYLTHDDLRAIIAAGGVRALLAAATAPTPTPGG